MGERVLFLSDLFILQQVIHPQSAAISTFGVTSPCPVIPLLSESCLSRETHQKETLALCLQNQDTNKYTTLWMGGFWFLAASVHHPYEAVRRVI